MIPDRFKDAKYSDVPKKIRGLFEVMPQTKRGIYIHGAVGTGKTYIAYALKSRYDVPYNPTTFRPGRTSIFWNTTELLRELRMDFDRDKYEKKNLAEEMMNSVNNRLLILDDLGSEKMSDWVGEVFYLIVNNRYNNLLPTIFTSNFSIPDLAERIGERIVSRTVEMCDVVELVGLDRRVKNIKKVEIKI